MIAFARIPRIIGGQNADIRDYPYSVSIRLELDRYKHICGGAIISHHHILTAAQCVYGINAESIVIYIGRTSAPDYSVRSYTITKIKIHPEFIGKIKPNSKTHNDIAVLTTLQYIIFSGNQNQINLPTADVEVGANAVITSWGMTSYPDGYTATTLQKASMVIVPNSECANNLPFPVYNENLCAVQGPGVGTCYVSLVYY
ncbi:PREDICTED: mite allergen Der f 6-like [Ceratosolen solmsi marchali]|uniref:Mite allergen Der f 6-like n=1 Tax=Ceratosolen solmsi marchali TaxID=326594 RepID=A0AAJ6YWR7_9HYME|nr:PREDICTED: mite allergen Der f 6-like [Ceratosolen solmsi marchali]